MPNLNDMHLEFNNSIGRRSLILNGFEYHADAYATERMADGFYRSTDKGLNQGIVSPTFKAMIQMSELSRLRLWFTTIGALFILLEVIRLKNVNSNLLNRFFSVSTHPLPAYRYINFVHWTRETLKMSNIYDSQMFDKALDAATKDLNIVADNLNIEPFSSQKHDKYLQNYNESFTSILKIKDRLLKYSKNVQVSYQSKWI